MRPRVIEVDPKSVKLLEVNARFMRHETFQRLAANVKEDGALTQIPFAVPSGDPDQPWEVISGNHRVKAAVAAALPLIQLQVVDVRPPEEKVRAIQVSHNAITGEDDPATLKAIYESIPSLDLKEYCGLDDKTLQLLASVTTESGPAAALDWTSVTFSFLPDEADRLRAAIGQAVAAVSKRGVHAVARFRDYDRFMEALATAGGAHAIVNAATALVLMLEVFERHLGDLECGFLDDAGEPRRKGTVPAAAALGSTEVPAATASLLNRVLARSPATGNRFVALDDALAVYLGRAAHAP